MSDLKPGTVCGGGDYAEEVMDCGCLPSEMCACEQPKICNVCGEEKSISEFGKRHNRPSRHRYCKACDAVAAMARRPSRNKETRKATAIRDRKENPKRYKAKSDVDYAIRCGRMVRKPCEVCGTEPTHAHHDDYDKPLDVKWLCPLHHKRHHIKARAILDAEKGE